MINSNQQRAFFLVVLFSALLANSASSAGTKFQLIHRHDLRKNQDDPPAQLERLRQLLHGDNIRVRRISSSHKHSHNHKNYKTSYDDPAYRKKDYNASGEMPMESGADYGTGQYFVEFKVGTPAQKLRLIADSGSDLTWMNCGYRCRGRGGGCGKNSSFFRADRSSSFTAVPCSSRLCKIGLADLFSLARCPSPMDPCAYDYRYSDGSSTQGFFANETVTFRLTNGRKTKLHNVLVGCSESSNGQSFQGADGILGLGYSNYSFALKSADKRFDGKFSYCLVDHLSSNNTSSYLIFGHHEKVAITLNKMEYTELVLGVISPYYAVNIRGISAGKAMLEIPGEVWNVNGVGGVIVDSGSSLTYLSQPAYEPVMAAMRASLSSFGNLDLDIGPLEYCFNSTGFDESLVPRLVFHFANGARFEPPVKSYVIDADEGVKCLGIVEASWPGVSVIGNIIQQNYLWEFDVVNGRLGFASSSCR